jgi:pimeloyl-ACP methyl ester carboxylesterase
MEAFAQQFAVVAWDAPGCGLSSEPPASFRLPDYADCLADFIAGLGLERPALVGLSFGGALVFEVAHRHPEVAGAIVAADAYAGWSGSFPADVVQQRLRQSLADLELPPSELVTKWLPGFLTGSAPPDLAEELAQIMAGFRPAGMAVMIRALAEADLRAALPSLSLPTLLLWGEEDVRSPLSVAKDIHARIPGSTLRILPGAGHLSNVEAASAFNAELRTFLASLQ